MANKRYVAGANFERRVVRWYEGQGYDPVIRSAGSHGLSDVTAFFCGHIFFNSLRLDNYWSPVDREEFEIMVGINNAQGTAYGRYVWRDDKNRIQFKGVE